MARAILVIGEPGSGKTRAITGLDPKKTVVIKPNSKELPFRGAGKNYINNVNMYTLKSFKGVGELLDLINKAPQISTVVVEDLTHYFSKRVIDERNIKGYDKWTELAANVKQYVIDKESELRPDLNIIVIGHVSATTDASGITTIDLQTPGKLLDNSIKIPSYFTYVFHTFVDQDDNQETRYRFLTNKDSMRAAKTPEGMFPKYIENNFQTVIDGIVAYQLDEGITPVGVKVPTKEELAKAKAKAKAEAEALENSIVPNTAEENVASAAGDVDKTPEVTK